jgi:hypothetical protein
MYALMNASTNLRDEILQVRTEVRQFQSNVEAAAAEFDITLASRIAQATTIASKLQAIRQRLLAH